MSCVAAAPGSISHHSRAASETLNVLTCFHASLTDGLVETGCSRFVSCFGNIEKANAAQMVATKVQ